MKTGHTLQYMDYYVTDTDGENEYGYQYTLVFVGINLTKNKKTYLGTGWEEIGTRLAITKNISVEDLHGITFSLMMHDVQNTRNNFN